MLERDDDPLAALRAENAELRRRISALEAARAVPYDRIFENQLVPLVVYRADGLAVAMNGRHAGVLGVPKEAVVGVHNILRDPESRAGGYTEAFEKALKGEIVRMPAAAYNPAGGDVKAGPDRQLWGEAVYVPIRGPEGVEFVVGVHRDVTDLKRAEMAKQQSEDLVRAISQNASLILYVKDREGRYRLWSRGCEEFVGVPASEAIGKTDADIFPPDLAAFYRSTDVQLLREGTVPQTERAYDRPDGARHMLVTRFLVRDAAGEAQAVCGILTDLTRIRRMEAEILVHRDEIIRVQEEALHALSTPLLPIADRVVAMPIIGAVDRERAQRVLETMLHGVAAHRAKIAILDVTGMAAADDEVASAISRAARAVGLLGASVVLTGIRPEVAAALVSIGVDLAGVVTLSTLQDGIAYALKQ